MNVKERMRMCQLIEKMDDQKVYSKRLGLENKSSFRGIPMNHLEEKERGNKI